MRNPPPMRSRFFNQLTYDSSRQTITKRSYDEKKLAEEILWYLTLPDELQRYIPSIIDYSLEENQVFVTMQYVPLPTAGDLYLAGEATARDWQSFFTCIETLLHDFSRFKQRLHAAPYLEAMYLQKTWSRLAIFLEENEIARDIHKKGYFQLNGRTVSCPLHFLEKHESSVRQCISEVDFQLIHGDLCFSNIFVNLAARQLIVIDPRGNFGGAGAFGDVRYDLAKIRHSLSGYEHIIRDRYDLFCRDGQLEAAIPMLPCQRELRDFWDQRLGSSLREVKLIESLLFLSMLPLHRDHPKRQLALYAVGTQLLSDALTM